MNSKNSCYVGSLKSSKQHEIVATPDEILKFVKQKKVGYEIIKETDNVMPYFEYDIYYATEAIRKLNFENDRLEI